MLTMSNAAVLYAVGFLSSTPFGGIPITQNIWNIPFLYITVFTDIYIVFNNKNMHRQDPVDNSMGSSDPTRVFHNRWTSPQRKVGTGHAIDRCGFGNPGLHREIGAGGTPRAGDPPDL